VGFDGSAPGAAALHLVSGVPLLRPDEQVFAAMLDGWRNQQLARNLAFSTVERRGNAVRAFAAAVNEYPWRWSPQLLNEYLGDARSVRHVKRSTVRSYQDAIRSFCWFVTDPAYGWAEQCETRFGTHPIQIVHEWNTAAHVQENESDAAKRAFTRLELQEFFAYCDDEVARIRALGRKGWLPAFRDATLLKTAYAFGLRRNETRMLDVADFGRNPQGREFGEYGVCYVRFGKAMKGSPPKRRSVLTVFPWSADVLDQYITEVRPAFSQDKNPAAWPSERGARVGVQRLNSRFAAYRDALGLDPGLDFHSLRRSYVTHLIEDGYDARFVQEQVGHEHASTTSIYTCVSSDYRTRTLRRALDGAVDAALRGSPRRSA
jgi:integrase/recombinase XerC